MNNGETSHNNQLAASAQLPILKQEDPGCRDCAVDFKNIKLSDFLANILMFQGCDPDHCPKWHEAPSADNAQG